MASRFSNIAEKLGSVWLVLPPFVVAILSTSFLGQVFSGATVGTLPCWTNFTLDYGAAAGIAVSTTFTLLVLAGLGAIVTAITILRLQVGTSIGWYVLLAITLVVLAARLVLDTGPTLIDDLGRPTFIYTVGAYFAHVPPACPPIVDSGMAGADQVTAVSLKFLDRSIRFSGILGILVTVAIAVAIVPLASLPPLPDIANPIDDAGRVRLNTCAHALGERIRRLKYLTFAAAAVLFTGIAYLKSWAEWPLSFWHNVDKVKAPLDGAFLDAYQAVEGARVSFQAVYFVLIILAIFGPAALLLAARGRQLAGLDPKLVDDPVAKQAWLTAHGLSLTTGEQVQRALLIISPLLAAPIAAAASQIIGLLH